MKQLSVKTRSRSPDSRLESWTRDFKVPEREQMDTEIEENTSKRPVGATRGFFLDYVQNSSIHGVRYMGETHRPWVERIWWMIAFTLSIICCFKLIYNMWIKWDHSQVIVSFDEKRIPVWSIPFPAVTICPQTKALTHKFNLPEFETKLIKNVLKIGSNNFHLNEFQKFEALTQVCVDHRKFDLLRKVNMTMVPDPDIVQTLWDLSPKIDNIMVSCHWRSSMKKCSQLFSPIVTDLGICYSFNSLNDTVLFRTENLHPDYKYFKTHNEFKNNEWNIWDAYPRYTYSSGARAGLQVNMVHNEDNLNIMCSGPVEGYKIFLHHPSDVSPTSKEFFYVQPDTEVGVAVNPNMINTSEVLGEYPPNKRQCFYNEERHLKFFKIYTQQNCELECLTNYTLNICNCVKFSMPRDKNTPVCRTTSIGCCYYAEDQFYKIFQGFGEIQQNINRTTDCNCLPACTSITYDAETSQADINIETVFRAYSVPLYPGVQMARLTIFFKESQFTPSKRSELYGLTDFLANCGGLLGLFMGVSILSIAEIFYYLTVRLFSNLCLWKKRRASAKASVSATTIAMA